MRQLTLTQQWLYSNLTFLMVKRFVALLNTDKGSPPVGRGRSSAERSPEVENNRNTH